MPLSGWWPGANVHGSGVTQVLRKTGSGYAMRPRRFVRPHLQTSKSGRFHLWLEFVHAGTDAAIAGKVDEVIRAGARR